MSRTSRWLLPAAASTVLALAACSSGGGSIAGMGASAKPSSSGSSRSSSESSGSSAEPSATASPSSTPSPVATASAAETKAFFQRGFAAQRKARYIEVEMLADLEGDRIGESHLVVDARTTPRRSRVDSVVGKHRLTALVERDGDVFALGLITNMPKTWVRIRPHGTDGISKAFTPFGTAARDSANEDPVKSADALVLRRGVVHTGSDQILDDPVEVYRAEIDLAATLRKKAIDPDAAKALKALHPPKDATAYLELQVDRTGLIRHMEEWLGPLHYEFTVHRTKPGHSFDEPRPSSVASPDRIRILPRTTKDGTTAG